jgi:tRNA threonylcarbamoyladenosine biosynthesis protein TsaE
MKKAVGNTLETEPLELKSRSSKQTQLVGKRIGKLAQSGDIFLLTGNLGTGKTCLIQGMARGLGVKEYPASPSFVIAREYHGRLTLYHIDFFRLDRIEEIAKLGLEEYLYSNGVCAVEWAEKGLELLPQWNLLITLDYVSACDTERVIRLEPQGERYRELVRKLKASLE